MRRDTLIGFFEDLANARGSFLVYDDGFRSRSFSYSDVSRASRAFAARLQQAGLQKNDHAIFYSENRPEWIAAFWGCLLAGVVVVPIDYRASSEFLDKVAGIVSAKVILAGQDTAQIPPTTVPIWPLNELNWPDRSVDYVGRPVSADDVAEIIFTSGATSDPKGVLITHRNLLANIVPVEGEIQKYRKWLQLVSPVRFLNLLPLSHMFGQAMATFIPPMLAGTVLFMRGYNPEEIAAQIRKRRVSVLVSVPKILDVLNAHVTRTLGARPDVNLSSRLLFITIVRRWWHYRHIHQLFGWKFWAFVVGAAPLDRALEESWRKAGFAVIQGYGLTETAPIVTINHPFGGKAGSVGKAIAGVELRIAPDGEVLVRGENVTRGYVGKRQDLSVDLDEGWLHTGDIGEIGPDGGLFIRGRKKEMIVTPEGLNVFPEDVEHVLNEQPGVVESAVVGSSDSGGERVEAVLVLEAGRDPEEVVKAANLKLADHQKIRRVFVWPGAALPRTDGTEKLKRTAIRVWANAGGSTNVQTTTGDPLDTLIAKYAGRSAVSSATTIDELGLSSLERVDLMVALEDRFGTRVDEAAFADARDVAAIRHLLTQAPSESEAARAIDFPSWNRGWLASAIRRLSLPTWILPLARLFAWIQVEGLENLTPINQPVIFASNHQSHLDTPVILAALPASFRYRVAPAMAKEFFSAHFFPERASRTEYLTNSLSYYLAALFFGAFPIPQREAGARHTLRYIGELVDAGFSILIFPEGSRTDAGEIHPFKPGVGMMASRLGVPVVPVRLTGVERVLHRTWHMARPGRVRVTFGAPIVLKGEDYAAAARQVEAAVRQLET